MPIRKKIDEDRSGLSHEAAFGVVTNWHIRISGAAGPARVLSVQAYGDLRWYASAEAFGTFDPVEEPVSFNMQIALDSATFFAVLASGEGLALNSDADDISKIFGASIESAIEDALIAMTGEGQRIEKKGNTDV